MRSGVSNGAQDEAEAGDGWFISFHLSFIELFICVAGTVVADGDFFSRRLIGCGACARRETGAA
ncbi:MAG TPA: hypothetical protein VGB76_13500 [Pyrinomonadaceae bacterium]